MQIKTAGEVKRQPQRALNERRKKDDPRGKVDDAHGKRKKGEGNTDTVKKVLDKVSEKREGGKKDVGKKGQSEKPVADPNTSMYRLKMIGTSFKALYGLPKDKVDAFMESYDVYNYDWADEKEMIAKLGPDYYTKVKKKIVDWYSVLNHICTIGHIEKMYIPPAMDLSKGIIENQNLFEERMAKDLRLKKGSKALDIGCGRGRIANHISSYTGSHLTGINIDPGQLENAKAFAKGRNMAQSCEFKLHDLNDLPLPFADNSLDGVYHVQVFSLSKDLNKLMKDIHRIIKPGGYFACLDWVQLDAYNPKNPKHADLMRKIKPLIGAIGTPTIKQYTNACELAGFEVTVSENASINGLQAPLIENADKFFNRLKTLAYFLVRIKALPQHFKLMLDRFTQDGKAFVTADRLRIVTTSYYIVAKKKPTQDT
jgi:sterol 24-C-methyltransferase